MGWQGSFSRVMSQRAAGCPVFSFVLKNTNLLSSETVDLMLCDAYQQSPWYFRDVKIKAGDSIRIDLDNGGWEWYNGDFCAILGRNNTIKQRWTLNLKRYAPGECPECHGSHKCGHCRGEGYQLNNRTVEITRCAYCGGSGICMTCRIPERKPPISMPSVNPIQQTRGQRNAARISAIQSEIANIQSQIDKIDWDMRMMQLDGRQVRQHSTYQSLIQLRYNYNIQLINLQQQLQGLL